MRSKEIASDKVGSTKGGGVNCAESITLVLSGKIVVNSGWNAIMFKSRKIRIATKAITIP